MIVEREMTKKIWSSILILLCSVMSKYEVMIVDVHHRNRNSEIDVYRVSCILRATKVSGATGGGEHKKERMARNLVELRREDCDCAELWSAMGGGALKRYRNTGVEMR